MEQSHGYTPMADPTPEPPAVPDYDDAIAAAEELTRKREAETPIITRDYIQLGGDHAGEPVGDNETVDARRAARDLAKIREVEAAETSCSRTPSWRAKWMNCAASRLSSPSSSPNNKHSRKQSSRHRLGCTAGTLKVRCSQAQISLRVPKEVKVVPLVPASPAKPRQPKRCFAFAVPTTLQLSKVAMSRLRQRAEATGMTEAELVTTLIEVIAQDDLYDAVLDTGAKKISA